MQFVGAVGANPVGLGKLAEVMEHMKVLESTDLGHATVTVGTHPTIGDLVIVNVVNGRTVLVCDPSKVHQ